MKTKNQEQQISLRKHFVEGLYKTLETIISPSPLLEIRDKKDNDDYFNVRFLNGKGQLPKPNTYEITVLDLVIASLFFDDFHVLFEGETGIGKTYTAKALFETIFGPDGYYTLRLSGGVLGSSPLEPFIIATLENGVPKIRIDHEKCSKYGALFIDEINRGDSQEVFQVVDGIIHVNGDTGYLRLPIKGTNRYKNLAIIAAMNPSNAEYNGTMKLDLAGENRFLKFKFPNGVTESSSSQLEKKLSGDLHDKFWTEFKKRSNMDGGWREIYPIVTDPEQVSEILNGATKEFIDVALGYVGEDPIKTYERNAELINQINLQLKFKIRKDNEYDKIISIQNNLKQGFVRRDLKKIQDLSRLIGFIKSIKNGSYNPSVTLNDVAASIGIILESKQITDANHGDLITLIKDVRRAYDEIIKEMEIPNGYGLRQSIWQAAVYSGKEYGFQGYINTLEKSINQLNKPVENVAQATIRSRILADLVVLNHFSKSYEQQITEILKEKEPFIAFNKLYLQKKSQSSVYEHRLESIIR